ncbi:MAG: phosphoenolpyruvate carboxykinase (ATP) [Atopobiaceae bacterium]|jgi:phosphoenolpyruvate carboxykinase (ATP)|nr:phosphoenolpyruvate carboxykinase (ATP) [Atopobiaceae bacterium]MCH4180106.1 phosphoenolpyruvate carboxykinase (ATP) [Atopobiaceae bacterium]MCH4213842.1 phosphoenolpyruvate carboxykinase (ATP) [Atopobiaceae bacterium]MCH4229944.1 phosphoenolpyruvate carboxykinase (ATP) [Atopobiaceae bacterium]MCH4275695.1 phosphoenolpyruvate carboxykinase (ATP) [Atopobiaceae bacterium]
MTLDILRAAGIDCPPEKLHADLTAAELVEWALKRGEGELAVNGSLCVTTGERTGRSPNDRFVVDDPAIHDRVAWGPVNVPIDRAHFSSIRDRAAGRLSDRNLFVVRAMAGADRAHSRKVMVVCELASQALFAHQMLIRPTAAELADYGQPDILVLAAPGLHTDPERDAVHSDAAVILDLARGQIVVAGTAYSGEIKKGVFSFMNWLLPVEDDVLPMHCSANMDQATGETAVLFGLSGTGKTTLSADPFRDLIGDDEHGWSDKGVFNIEGGCYAKTIDLDAAAEPQIYNAISFGSMCENVVIDSHTRRPDYTDGSLTENTRVAYPVEHIDKVNVRGTGQVPSVVLFLACDAFGVLPPISRLSRDGAMYHFLMGFTSKVAGTEQGVKTPQPTFSALFGEPFMPLDPMEYARMLGDRIDRYHTRVYLVNTGWSGGPYGVGSRIKLKVTRALVTAALANSIGDGGWWHDDRLNLDVPRDCPFVKHAMLDPKSTWKDPEAYKAAALTLAEMFEEHRKDRYPDLDADVIAAGPSVS